MSRDIEFEKYLVGLGIEQSQIDDIVEDNIIGCRSLYAGVLFKFINLYNLNKSLIEVKEKTNHISSLFESGLSRVELIGQTDKLANEISDIEARCWSLLKVNSYN